MFPKIKGTFLGVPCNKDYSILGSILGYPNFEKLPHIQGRKDQNVGNYSGFYIISLSPLSLAPEAFNAKHIFHLLPLYYPKAPNSPM